MQGRNAADIMEDMGIGQRMQRLREEDGMTQEELGEKLGVSQGTVSQWESGKRVPGGEAVKAMAELFDTTADFILGIVDEEIKLVPYFRELKEEEELLMQAYAQLTGRQKRIVEELVSSLADMNNRRG